MHDLLIELLKGPCVSWVGPQLLLELHKVFFKAVRGSAMLAFHRTIEA